MLVNASEHLSRTGWLPGMFGGAVLLSPLAGLGIRALRWRELSAASTTVDMTLAVLVGGGAVFLGQQFLFWLAAVGLPFVLIAPVEYVLFERQRRRWAHETL